LKARARRKGGGGEFRLARAEAKPRRPARSEQNPAKKFSFPFRRKNRARAKSEMRTKLFFGVASVSERRRGGASVSFKEGSRIFKQRAPQKDYRRIFGPASGKDLLKHWKL